MTPELANANQLYDAMDQIARARVSRAFDALCKDPAITVIDALLLAVANEADKIERRMLAEQAPERNRIMWLFQRVPYPSNWPNT